MEYHSGEAPVKPNIRVLCKNKYRISPILSRSDKPRNPPPLNFLKSKDQKHGNLVIVWRNVGSM